MNAAWHAQNTQNTGVLPPSPPAGWKEGGRDRTARLGATSTAQSWPTRPQDGIRWTTGSFLNIQVTFWMPTELFLEL